jgi:hypothetical protein
MLYQLAV